MPRSAPEAFSATVEAYLATMAPGLRPVAAEVVRRARLAPSERVLDVGTGTGQGAAAALGDGREVVGVDAATGMLARARAAVPAATFVEGDFLALPFPDRGFDVVIAVHSLHFAGDPGAALVEWRRVTRPGGRLSLSLPGPREATAAPVFEAVHRRFGIHGGRIYPNETTIAGWAQEAGWAATQTGADPAIAIELADREAFDLWMATGSRGQATGEWTEERQLALRDAMFAVAPRMADGTIRIPFGALYLTAANPG